MNYEQAIASLQDTLVVMAEIQRRQAEVQKNQAELIDYLAEGRKQHEEWRRHMEVTLSEITDKLNGLIGFNEGQFGTH